MTLGPEGEARPKMGPESGAGVRGLTYMKLERIVCDVRARQKSRCDSDMRGDNLKASATSAGGTTPC
eukprot:scaffold29332_cov80-Skeletonema_dohrnii-CCMP3373.AAC.5